MSLEKFVENLPSQNWTVLVMSGLWLGTFTLIATITLATVFGGQAIPDGILGMLGPWMAGIFGGAFAEAYRYKAKRESWKGSPEEPADPPLPFVKPDDLDLSGTGRAKARDEGVRC